TGWPVGSAASKRAPSSVAGDSGTAGWGANRSSIAGISLLNWSSAGAAGSDGGANRSSAGAAGWPNGSAVAGAAGSAGSGTGVPNKSSPGAAGSNGGANRSSADGMAGSASGAGTPNGSL